MRTLNALFIATFLQNYPIHQVPSEGCLKYRHAKCLCEGAGLLQVLQCNTDLTSIENAGVRVGKSPSKTEFACFCGCFVLFVVMVIRVCWYFVLFMVEDLKFFFPFNTVAIKCFLSNLHDFFMLIFILFIYLFFLFFIYFILFFFFFL